MLMTGNSARRGRAFIALLLTASCLAGCAEIQAGNQVDEDGKHAAALARIASAPAAFVDTDPVKVSRDVYIGARAAPIGNSHELPERWRTRKVTFVESRSLDLRGVADLITQTTGLPVSYSGNEGKHVVGTAKAAGAQADLTSRRVTLAAGGPIPAGFNPAQAQAIVDSQSGASDGVSAGFGDEDVPAGRMRVNFTGMLPDFLDLVADDFGVVWSSDGDRIVFSSEETKVFDVPALPLVLKLSHSFDAGLDNSQTIAGAIGGGSGSSGGAQEDQVTSTAAFELWKDINTTLKSVVDGDGGVEVSGPSGTVTVTARPETVERVANYISELNRRLEKEVVLSLTVYSVVLNRSDNYSADLNLALQKAGAWGGTFATAGATGTASAAAAGAASALSTSLNSSTPQGLTAGVLSGPFAGSNGIVQALSTVGNVSTVNSQSLTTVNGIPVPFQDANIQGFVSSVTTTALVAGSSSASTSLQPSTVKTGFSLTMTPHVNNDGTVLLSYALDLSELAGAINGFNEFSSGGQTVQLPDINTRNFVQEAVIPANSTLVLSGVELTTNSSSRSGVGSPDVPIFGGNRSGETKRELLVVAITPHILDLGSGRVSE